MASLYTDEVSNWNQNRKGSKWTHKNNPEIVVEIIKNESKDKRGKYIIFHAHPGPRGSAIPQKFEYADTIQEARKKVIPHLKHWNNPWKWAEDPDFGKSN
jgi:hypothetical protein